MPKRPATYPPMSPYLTVSDSDAAIDFYRAAFKAKELYRLTDPKSGAVVHAEIMLNDSHIMLADENPEWGTKSPRTLGGTAGKICLMVRDTDKAVAKAVEAGAVVEMPATDMFYGYRCATVRDPFGHEWLIQHEFETVSPKEMQRRWNEMAGDDCKK